MNKNRKKVTRINTKIKQKGRNARIYIFREINNMSGRRILILILIDLITISLNY